MNTAEVKAQHRIVAAYAALARAIAATPARKVTESGVSIEHRNGTGSRRYLVPATPTDHYGRG